jgi:hypothetical protein
VESVQHGAYLQIDGELVRWKRGVQRLGERHSRIPLPRECPPDDVSAAAPPGYGVVVLAVDVVAEVVAAPRQDVDACAASRGVHDEDDAVLAGLRAVLLQLLHSWGGGWGEIWVNESTRASLVAVEVGSSVRAGAWKCERG